MSSALAHLDQLVAKGKLLPTDASSDVREFVRGGAAADLCTSVLDDFANMAANNGLAEIKSRSGYLLGMLRQRSRKQRRQARQSGQEERGAPPSKRPRKEADKEVDLRGVASTLFVNQLPYAATKEDVAAHFVDPAAHLSAPDVLPRIRMVMKGERFTGTAFIDLPSQDAMQRGLTKHGSDFQCAAGGPSRVINVRPAMTRQQAAALKPAEAGAFTGPCAPREEPHKKARENDGPSKEDLEGLRNTLAAIGASEDDDESESEQGDKQQQESSDGSSESDDSDDGDDSDAGVKSDGEEDALEEDDGEDEEDSEGESASDAEPEEESDGEQDGEAGAAGAALEEDPLSEAAFTALGKLPPLRSLESAHDEPSHNSLRRSCDRLCACVLRR
jgi:hypothetical protein